MSGHASGFLLVRARERLVALPLAYVLEVTAVGAIHSVPTIERAMRGLVTVHGRAMPLVHLGALLDGTACPPAAGSVGVVIAVEGRRLCLEIEAAELLVREPALPVPPGETLPWAIGVARHAGTLVPLLDVAALSSRLMEAA